MFDKFVNDNNIFKDKMVNSTIHTAKQIIDNLTITPPNQRLLTIELLLLR